MIYQLLADLTVLFHFLWILFIIFGLLLVWKWAKIAFLHLGGLLFSLIINLFGWYCPLTYLENYLYASGAREAGYKGSFIAHSLVPIVYPDLPEKTIRIGEMIFVVLLLVVYGALARRYYRKARFLRRQGRKEGEI